MAFSKIELNETEDIEFVDQGSNFQSVSCNLCGKVIDMQFWQDAVDKAYKTHFEKLTFTTPCCHKTTALNDLNYNSPAGFAKFIILISYPQNDLNPNEILELEKKLGTKIRKI